MKTIATDWINGRPNPIALSQRQATAIARLPAKERVATILFLGSISSLAQGKVDQAAKEIRKVLGGKRAAARFGKLLDDQLVLVAARAIASSRKRAKEETT